MTDMDLRRRFDRVHAASRSSTAPDAAARRKALATLGDLVTGNAGAIAAAISQDFRGRSLDETQMLEMLPALRGIRHAARHVEQWMRDRSRPVDLVFQPAKAWVRYEPLGVIGIISPWNYPLLLALSPLTDALAAGNRAMIKPSELTPCFSDLLADLIARHFPLEQITVVTGGVDTARAFSALPFDHLVFTGSTAVGRHVMRAAAENLTPVTLELGGKSPAIVAPDYSIDKAASSIAFGKFVNAGQTCIAPDYALVPEAAIDQFAEAVIAAARHAYPTIADNPDYTAIISEAHRERLDTAIAEARDAGARVLTHGARTDNSTKRAPVVVVGAPRSSRLMQEEIFGPVLPVVGYRDLDDALAIVNSYDRPLALYCFAGSDRSRARILDGATSGGVTVNGTLLHLAQDGLPFGGIGMSGIGAYHGRDGFVRFSHARAVHQVGSINFFERLGPPWGRVSRLAGRLLSR